jgi:hypothetical protein
MRLDEQPGETSARRGGGQWHLPLAMVAMHKSVAQRTNRPDARLLHLRATARWAMLSPPPLVKSTKSDNSRPCSKPLNFSGFFITPANTPTY